MRSFVFAVMLTVFGFANASSLADDPKEEDFYKILTFEPPKGMVLEAGALAWMPDGKLAVSTRRGEIYLVENPLSADPAKDAKFSLFAKGLHEVLGLAYRDGFLYATQRGEVTKLKDTNGDGRADVFETFCDAWEITGDYHEYAFGSKFDKDGNLWVALCLTGSFTSDQKFRGWALKIAPDGTATPVTSGLRSPGGLGTNAEGDLFYSENQGPWNGACSIKHLEPGAFMGHPDGNVWYKLAPNMGPAPETPKSGGRLLDERKRIPKLRAPAVWFPYQKMGQSASGIACDQTGGKFGPFGDQLFVGDQAASTIMRVDLEKVDGRYHGACFPFRQGFASGCLPSLFGPDGALFVGGTNRGWGSRGPREFSLERLIWTGKMPFEILHMKAKPDGFTLSFTEPVNRETAANPASYSLETYTYIYQSSYGSPEVDQTSPKITKVDVAADGRSVTLLVDKLQEGHVHELHLDGVRADSGVPLLHPRAYYTMNAIPKTIQP